MASIPLWALLHRMGSRKYLKNAIGQSVVTIILAIIIYGRRFGVSPKAKKSRDEHGFN